MKAGRVEGNSNDRMRIVAASIWFIVFVLLGLGVWISWNISAPRVVTNALSLGAVGWCFAWLVGTLVYSLILRWLNNRRLTSDNS